MDLNIFVKETLLGIAIGIKDANKQLGRKKGEPQPFLICSCEKGAKDNTVDFDLAVTTKSEKGKEGGAKINVLGNELGGKGKDYKNVENVSRIQFKIQVKHVE